MRCTILILALTATVMVVGNVASAAPPARPLQLTAAQLDRLCQIESQTQHVAILDVRASYTSEREAKLETTRLADDISTAAYQFGWPGTILLIVLLGAPL